MLRLPVFEKRPSHLITFSNEPFTGPPRRLSDDFTYNLSIISAFNIVDKFYLNFSCPLPAGYVFVLMTNNKGIKNRWEKKGGLLKLIDVENCRFDIVIEILTKYHYRFRVISENKIYLIDEKIYLELPKEPSNGVLVEFDRKWNPNRSAAFVSIFSTYAIWEGYNFDPGFYECSDGRLLAGWKILDEW